MRQYRAFGLNLESEIPLAELEPCDFEKADVSIRLGRVNFVSGAGQARRTEVAGDQFLLDMDGVARFRAENGGFITVEPYPDARMEEITMCLMGSCMGAVLLQRRIFPVHGSCLRTGNAGMILTGKSGAGKSTIAAGFLLKGCQILTDDVSAVRFDAGGRPVVSPSYPAQKLWEDAAERMEGVQEKTPIYRNQGGQNKFAVRRDDCFCRESTPLAAVYEIVPCQVPDVTLTEIKGAEKVDVLLNNIYRKGIARRMGLAGWCCSNSMAIAQNLKIFRVVRPAEEHLEKRIVEIILGSQRLASTLDSPRQTDAPGAEQTEVRHDAKDADA
jgi:hypothetical protein